MQALTTICAQVAIHKTYYWNNRRRRQHLILVDLVKGGERGKWMSTTIPTDYLYSMYSRTTKEYNISLQIRKTAEWKGTAKKGAHCACSHSLPKFQHVQESKDPNRATPVTPIYNTWMFSAHALATTLNLQQYFDQNSHDRSSGHVIRVRFEVWTHFSYSNSYCRRFLSTYPSMRLWNKFTHDGCRRTCYSCYALSGCRT